MRSAEKSVLTAEIPDDPDQAAKVVAGVLCSSSYSACDERGIQDQIEEVLIREGIPYKREHRLSAADKVDFLVADKIAVEVKTKGATNAVLRQLQRYARHDTTAAVILATTRIALVAGLPETLHATPVRGCVLPVRGGL